MGNSNASRILFERLDKDGNGKLSLEEFVENKACAELVSICSLPILYHFDISKQGTLNFKEFVEMERFIQKVQKKVEKEQKLKIGETYKLFKREEGDIPSSPSPSASSSASSISITPTSTTTSPTNYNLAGTPLQKRSETEPSNGALKELHHSNSSSSISSMFSSPMRESAIKRVRSGEEMTHEVRKQIDVALLPSLHKEMYDKQGRKCFLEWLFKMSDVHKTERVSREELQLLLAAVKNDEIDLDSLVFGDEKDEMDVIQRILKEYDEHNLGYLGKEDFLKLADIILSKYEARHQENKSEEIVGEWKLGHLIGEGAYGKVRLGFHTQKAGVKRAVKIIKEGTVSDMSKLDVEIQAMQLLQHPNVVQLYEVLEHNHHIYLVLELCGGGSLYHYLKDQAFEEELARFYFTALIDGLSYCHQNGVVHRDLRLENLLLDNTGNLKITDFGQARIFKKGWDLFSTQLVGSLYHLSPEQILGKVYRGEQIDVWNAGIILYCFVTARLPFCSADVMEMFEDIKNANYTYPAEPQVSESVKNLIAGMLQPDPKKRLTIAQIRQHPWMKGKQQKPNLFFHHWEAQLSQCDTIEQLEPVLERIFEASGARIIQTMYPSSAEELSECTTLKPTVVKKEEVIALYKCIQPTKDVKFIVFLAMRKEQSKLCIEFLLKSGEGKDYHEIVTELEKKLTKIYKPQRNEQ